MVIHDSKPNINESPENISAPCRWNLVLQGTIYSQTQSQRCVTHMLRNPLNYVNYSNLKNFSSDFKVEYNAPNETFALYAISN